MAKKEEWIGRVLPFLNNSKKLETFLITHSNLPGPRSNLELAFGLAEVYDNSDVLFDWARITEQQADVNDPLSYIAFCAVICLGKVYTKNGNPQIISILKDKASDGRWRMREAVAFAFQLIGENDFNMLQMLFSDWINTAGNLEQRAILVALAHPPFLNEERAGYCFETADKILARLDKKSADFDVLRKGLEFTLSVFVAASPQKGFKFLNNWIGRDQTIDKIIRENLKKKRLIKANPEQADLLLALI